MSEELHPFIVFMKRFILEIILLSLAVLLTVFSFVLYRNTTLETLHDEHITPTQSATHIPSLMAELSGAVTHPGVYSLPEGSRIKDLLNKAGGLLKEADKTYISRNINQARYLVDQEKLYIPTIQEVTDGIVSERKIDFDYLSPQQSVAHENSPSVQGKIHINTATGEELDSLPGVGESTVNKIINGRPFNSLHDLLGNKIVTQNVFTQIKDLIDL